MSWTDRVHLGLGRQGALRVGAVGLPPKEELLLRSVVRVLDTQTERAWAFVEAPPYDVTFVGDGTLADAGGGVPVRVLPPGAREEAGDASIVLPIRPFNLRPLLDRLGQRLPRPSTASIAPAIVSPFLGLPASVETFVARVRRPDATPFVVVPIGGRPLIVVDPAAGVWSHPADANESARIPDLTARLLRSGFDCVDIEPADASLMSGPPLRLEALLWHFGVQATPGEALRPVARRATFRLTRWPDFGSIGGNDLLALKLAALLVQRPHRLDQIVAASRASRETVVDLLNACALCDLLAPEAPADARTPAPARERPSASRYGLVLHALRSALGISRS